ncbi:MAG: hypothetical protein RR348_06710, partial [Clostridia bacterium]
MFKEKRQKREEEEQRKREDAEFDAKYNAKIESKNVEKYIKTLDASVEKLMDKAVQAKKLGLDKSFRQLASQIKVLKLRQQQAQAFMFQYDVMLEMKDTSKASAEFLKSMNIISESLGGMNFAKEEIMNTKKILAQSNANIEKQNMMIDDTLEAFDSIGFAEQSESSTNIGNMDISDIENEVYARMGGAIDV